MYSFFKFKRVGLLLMLLSGFGLLQAQEQEERAGFDCFNHKDRLEVGILMGATYYMGDFNPNLTPLKDPRLYAGFMVRHNTAQYFSLRFNLAYAYLAGNARGMEGFSDDLWNREAEFLRPMLFFDALAEFNFMPYDAVDLRKKQRFTPLLSLGIGASFLLPDMGEEYIRHNNAVTVLDFPVGIGAKWCVAKRLTLGVEWTFRVSFNDDIDFYGGMNEHSPVINNDWIGTLGVSVSYLIKYNRSCPAHNRHRPSSRYFSNSRWRQPSR
jgi:hypothetical protein